MTRQYSRPTNAAEFIRAVSAATPLSEVRRRTESALNLSPSASAQAVARRLGSGDDVTAHDTVPFCIWCAAQHLDDYEGALWTAVAGLGDRDTTCAIVGGIMGGRVGLERIPQSWFLRREPLPNWVYSLRN